MSTQEYMIYNKSLKCILTELQKEFLQLIIKNFVASFTTTSLAQQDDFIEWLVYG